MRVMSGASVAVVGNLELSLRVELIDFHVKVMIVFKKRKAKRVGMKISALKTPFLVLETKGLEFDIQ
jgi:hypothetical protein